MNEHNSNFTNFSKLDQLKNNFKSWNILEWIFFFGIIPLICVSIFTIPQIIKNDYFIFNTSHVWAVQSYFLNAYTHTELFPHMVGNLLLYILTMLAIFAFENNHKRFFIISIVSFVLVPILGSVLTLCLFHFIGANVTAQGFSGINYAFLAYSFLIFIIWLLGDTLEQYDHPEVFKSKIIFYSTSIFLTIILGLVVVLGVLLGQFVVGNQISNGIVHFGGFITGLIVFLIFDVLTEKRKYFQLMLSISIVVGLIVYLIYLMSFVK